MGEGMKFCTSCGATVGEPSAPPAQTLTGPVPAGAAPSPATVAALPSAAPAAPVAAAPAAKSSSAIVKIILIVLAVIIFLTLLSIGSCVYFVYRTKQRVRQFESQVHTTFPTPMGTREVHPQAITPAAPTAPAGPVVDTGIPVYPGATPWGGGTQVIGPTASMKTQAYTTSDPVDQVMAFYKDKLPTAMVTQSGGQVVVQTLGANGEVTVAITTDAGLGKTKITINTIGK